MKKNKSKSKHPSASKKTRKELESKLALAFNEVVVQYGKAKKKDKIIEKFAKQLSKKVIIKVLIEADKDKEILVPVDEALPVSSVKPIKGKKLAKA